MSERDKERDTARTADTPAADEAAVVADELARLEAEDAERARTGAASGAAVAEPAAEAVARLEAQVAEWKDRALRAAADHDNYRRRAVRERDEAFGRGAGEVLARIIEVVDDLARVAHLDPEKTTPQALHDGMLAIERKFLKALENSGVERIDPAGLPFDPNAHEAVMAQAAPAPAQDQTVAAVFQHGYRFRGVLLRPARVAVFQWQGTPPAGDGAA